MRVKKKITLTICTSVGQVINAKSALDFLSYNNYENYIAIIHPILNKAAKDKINKIATILGYTNVIDFTQIIKNYEDIFFHASPLQKIKNFKTLSSQRLKKYNETKTEINNKINTEIGDIDYFFIRDNYKDIDLLFLNNSLGSKIYSIEDGHANYLPANWFMKKYTFYELKKASSNLFTKIRNYLFLSITNNTVLFSELKKIYFTKKINFSQKFTNMQHKNNICVKDFYKKNIEILSKEINLNNEVKAVIIGTTIDKNYKFNIDDEVILYNKAINMLIQKYDINNSEILYVPHPRIENTELDFKIKNLNCNIVQGQELLIVESIFVNKNLILAISFGSTSLYYAQKLFNIKSILLNTYNKDRHPSSFASHYYMSKKLKIEILDI